MKGSFNAPFFMPNYALKLTVKSISNSQGFCDVGN